MADIFSNKMQLQSNALGGILQALAQIKQKQDAEKMKLQQQDEATRLQSQFPLFTKIPSQTTPNPDYINSLPSENQQPFNTTPERQQFNMQNLIALMQNGANNPNVMANIGNMAKTAEIGKAFSPQVEQTDPYKNTFEVNPITGERKQIGTAQNKPAKASGAFGNFLVANAKKYESDPNGLETAWQDFNRESQQQFDTKQQTMAKYRPEPNKDAKSVGSYTSEDGFRVSIFRNPDGTLDEVKSQERVKEPAPSATAQKEDLKLSTLSELSKQIRSQAKPEYLGGVASGLVGGGFGGVTGGLREATGLISDEEAQFRSNVASLKNQLLYLRSGAQINEQEFKRLEKELPDPTQPQNVFMQRLNTFDKQLQDILRVKGRTTAPKQSNNADPLGIR